MALISPAELARLKRRIASVLVERKINYRHDVFVVEDLLHDSRRTRALTARQARVLWGQALQSDPAGGHALALYMHFPYCSSRCLYCISPSQQMRREEETRRYVEESRREIEFFSPAFAGKTFSLWGVGGGTPSLLGAEELRRWLAPAVGGFSFGPAATRTIEFNPISASREKLQVVGSLGFNRVSFGVQTLNADVLRAVNRGYQDRETVGRAIGWAREAGFEVVNADLIFGLVGESVSSFLEGFRALGELRPTMITVYCLDWLAPYGRATKWTAAQYERHRQSLLPEVLEKLPPLAARMGFRAREFWPQKAWYFAGPGHEVRLGDDDGSSSTLGVGWHSGSHVFAGALYVRKKAPFDPDAPLYSWSDISAKEEMGRYIICRLELNSRVDYADFRDCFQADVRVLFSRELDALRAAGKIREDGDGFDFLPTGSAERVFYIMFFFMDTIAKMPEHAEESAPSLRGSLSRAQSLELASRLICEGNLQQGAEEAVRFLESRRSEPSSLPGGVEALLDQFGWELRGRAGRGQACFAVREAGQDEELGELVLEPRRAGGCLTPVFQFRAIPRRDPGLSAAEGSGLDELSAALGLFLESLRRRGGEPAPAQAETHEEIGGARRLLRVTFACNQRCPFCFVPPARRRAGLAEIERELDGLAGRLGPRGILTISGGEPTIEPRLPEILASARRRGIRRFVLQTNAVALGRAGLLEELVKLGVRSYLVSFHSHRPALYDRITGSRGQFPRAVEGLSRLLRDRRCQVTCNVVVNARNFADLPELVDFLGAMSAELASERKPGVFFSMMNGAGHHRAPFLAVSLGRIAPYLRRALKRCAEQGLRVDKFGGESAFPLCLAENPRALAPRRIFPQDRVRYAENFSGEAGSVGRAKRPACRACPYDAKCLGVPAEYARIFGLGDLKDPSGLI